MKKFRVSLLCLLMCLLLILSFAGCRHEPVDPTGGSSPTTTAPSQPTTPTQPTDPSKPILTAADMYASAAKTLDSKNALALSVTVNTSISVAGETISNTILQELVYSDRKTNAPRIHLMEVVTFDSNAMPQFHETYIDGTLYVQYDSDTFLFCGAMDKDTCSTRYVPAVMLNTALYENITFTAAANGTTFSFSQPTGAEDWALPKGAVFSSASGSAITNNTGALTQMQYTITYQYGSITFTAEYQSQIHDYTGSVSLSGNAADYTVIQCPEALRYYPRAAASLSQIKSATVSTSESIFTQAAGVVRNQSVKLNQYGEKKDISALIETDVYLMNYGTNQEQSYSLEEKYLNNVYTAIEDGGSPTTYPNVSYTDIATYCQEITRSYQVSSSKWKDLSVTDLGSTILLEFTPNNGFADTIQDDICEMFWNNPDFLNNLASKYVTNEITGYFAIDKFTGFPTAMGYSYSGTHTIEGADYVLTKQADQSIEIPGMEAYYNITEEHAPEQEPEKKPTPLFYHVTGKDGQEMWLFGTIHIGDHRTAYLPKEIKDAFTASDALALEYNSKAFDAQVEDDEQLQAQVSDAYFLSDGKTLKDILGDELYVKALKYLKASGNYNSNANYMKPFLWETSLQNFFLRQGYSLRGSKGVESRLHAWAEEQKKPILEVESGLFQVQMMGNFSEELQTYMLASILSDDALESNQETMDLYEKWCAGDEAALRKLLNEEFDTADMTDEEKAEYEKYKHLVDEYNKAMDTDRNAGMLQVAKSYLESDQVVFFAVGLAHLLSEDGGLVDALRAAGYTVELVKYN